MHRLLAILVFTVIAAFAAVDAAAAAPPTSTPAQMLCAAQGGVFILVPTEPAMDCVKEQTSFFSEGQLRAARAMCEQAYQGFFIQFPNRRVWICVLQ